MSRNTTRRMTVRMPYEDYKRVREALAHAEDRDARTSFQEVAVSLFRQWAEWELKQKTKEKQA